MSFIVIGGLLWPYMAFGLLCSSAAQFFLVDQASIGNGAPLDVIDFPDLKSIHGFVGTILGTSQIKERKMCAPWMCSYVWCVFTSPTPHMVSTPSAHYFPSSPLPTAPSGYSIRRR